MIIILITFWLYFKNVENVIIDHFFNLGKKSSFNLKKNLIWKNNHSPNCNQLVIVKVEKERCQEWHLSMLFFVKMNKTNEVLVIYLFLFRRFDDHGHHYQEK